MLSNFDGKIGQYLIGKNCAKVNLPKSINYFLNDTVYHTSIHLDT